MIGRGLFLFCGVLFAVGACRSAPEPAPGPAQSRHIVVLVHGIFGDKTHFGWTKPALETHLRQDGVRFEVVEFEYDTLDAHKSIDDFARDLDATLASLATGEDDAISFVGHSQGGLVVLRWLALALDAEPGTHPALLPRVDAFVTLATPFWGSKLATFTRHFEPQAALGQGAALQPSSAQLTGMTFGSAQVEAFRQAGIELSQTGRPPPLSELRPLAIGGYVDWLKVAAWFSAGEREFEDDTAVLLPSSRPDFFYLEHSVEQGARHITPGAFSHAAFAPYHVVAAIHLSPTVDVPQLSPGIAQTPKACIADPTDCHPAFPLVLAHLLGNAPPPDDAALSSMTSFLVDFVVEHDQGRAIEGLAVTPAAPPPAPEGVTVAASRLLEPYSDTASPLKGRAGRAFTFTGTVTGAFAPGRPTRFHPAAARFVVEAPGRAPITVDCPVRPTQSTYVKLRLPPNAP